ncbi:MAG: hypothetical protein Q8R65_06240 [Polynucleobacter sp.]|nr:hypothetical protein [Polynucleobacter sp.]
MIAINKKFIFMASAVFFISGCAQMNGGQSLKTSQIGLAETMTAAEREQLKHGVSTIQDSIAECTRRELNTRDGKAINSQILVLTENNPVANKLLVSGQTLTNAQKMVLRRYIKQTDRCRSPAYQLKQEKLLAVYKRFFAGADAVYADLLSGKSNIGAANQRMQVLKVAARGQWADAISAINLY